MLEGAVLFIKKYYSVVIFEEFDEIVRQLDYTEESMKISSF